jgi:hypothetical protein
VHVCMCAVAVASRAVLPCTHTHIHICTDIRAYIHTQKQRDTEGRVHIYICIYRDQNVYSECI